MITVYCDGGAGRRKPRHERWDIGRYHREDDGRRGPVWRPDETLKGAATTLQWLDPDMMEPGTVGPERRWRYNFLCDICDAKLPQRGEAMLVVFDRLAGVGKDEISLRFLTTL
jgi:hypothetical protein